jgi:hypothetical protein
MTLSPSKKSNSIVRMFQSFYSMPVFSGRQGPAQIIFVLVVIVVAIWLLRTFLKKRQETSESYARNIVFGKPRNGKSPASFCSYNGLNVCPKAPSMYTLSVWLFLDDWDYKYGQWKHVVHRGAQNGSRVQPIVLLHPTQNKLVVAIETVQDKTLNIYDVKPNFFYPDHLIYKTFQNTTLDDVKDFCNNDRECAGFSAIVNAEGKVYTAYASKSVGAQGLRPASEIAKSVDFQRLLQSGNYKVNTFIKMKRQDVNPMLNAPPKYYQDNNLSLSPKNLYEIPNIPINQWFNFTMVVANNIAEFYLDGMLVQTATLNNFFEASDGNIYVSQPNPPQDGVPMAPGFSGRMAKLMYTNQRLSFTQVNKMFRDGPGVPSNMQFGLSEQPTDTSDLARLYSEQALDALVLSAGPKIGPDGYPLDEEKCN